MPKKSNKKSAEIDTENCSDLNFMSHCLTMPHNVSSERGNNQTLSRNKEYKSRRFVFVINNYTNEILENCKPWLSQKSHAYIVGEEVGEKGTPHLQGYCEFKYQVRAETIYNAITRKMWIRKAKGQKKANYDYCAKDGKFYTNIEYTPFIEKLKQLVLKEEYTGVVWKPWQQEILNKINNKAENRAIHWYWEATGNVGKSYLFKYIACTRNDVIICDGNKEGVLDQLRRKIHDEELIPKIIMIDIPRSKGLRSELINYGLVEQLQQGLIYSSKYEGGLCPYPRPHVIILANEEPNYDAWSADRYNVVEILS